MRLVFISDTHNQHQHMTIPDGDVLFHCGDFSGRGRIHEVQAFMEWLGQLPHQHKVIIAGNHDFLAEQDPETFASLVPPGVHYLNDSGCTIEGVKIWGSPIQPWFYDWAFNRQRGADIRQHWDLIPEDTQILIVHGPPYGILDTTTDGRPVGCRDLGRRILALPNIEIAAFGHIHEARGMVEQNGVMYLNVSMLDVLYSKIHSAVELDYPLAK